MNASVIIPMARALGVRVITTVLAKEIANNIKHLNANRNVATTKVEITEVLKELENGYGVDIAIGCFGGVIMGKCIHYLTHSCALDNDCNSHIGRCCCFVSWCAN